MNFKRAVIKVGSALVAPNGRNCSGKYIQAIAEFITKCHQQDKEIILVSSGGVAAGRGFIKHGSPIPSIQAKQAMASIGQMKMMALWQDHSELPCSQLLITHGDLKDRERYINIKNTLRVLLDNNILPIVNENDTVATQELKVGDNDNLAALVALVSEADALFILSDIDGVFEQDPRVNPQAKMLTDIEAITDDIYAMAGVTKNHIATGGMKTKIQAAEKAVENGVTTYIINGKKPHVFDEILQGRNPGTCFHSYQEAVKARKHWIKHTLKSNGQVLLDCGAISAVLNGGASLLPSGIQSVAGEFLLGEAIDIVSVKTGQVVAKGISQYSHQDLEKIKGRNSDQIENVLGYCPSKVVIHRDDLVVVSNNLSNNSEE